MTPPRKLSRRRILYGWRLPSGHYCLSRVPPDLPQLPAEVFDEIEDADAAAEQRKSVVVWSGPALQEKQRRNAS